MEENYRRGREGLAVSEYLVVVVVVVVVIVVIGFVVIVNFLLSFF